MPALVDELPLLALVACHARGETVVRGASELRLKESDRIEGVVDGLRRIGGHIRATRDGFRVRGVPARLRGGTFDSRGDHRLAMLGAVAGLSSIEASSSSAPMPSRRASRLLRRARAAVDGVGGKNRAMIVTIDGPAGSGKSTVAGARAAPRVRTLDTGAMYRALTWLALGQGVDDGDALATLAREHPVTFDAEGRVEIDGYDVSTEIRAAEIDRVVPLVAANQGVREVMRERQRALGSVGDAVIEGATSGRSSRPAPR